MRNENAAAGGNGVCMCVQISECGVFIWAIVSGAVAELAISPFLFAKRNFIRIIINEFCQL